MRTVQLRKKMLEKDIRIAACTVMSVGLYEEHVSVAH